MRICVKCGEREGIVEFYASRHKRKCKPCYRAYRTALYAANPDVRERTNKLRSKWRKAHPEYDVKWRAAHRERVRAYKKKAAAKAYAADPEGVRARNREYVAKSNAAHPERAYELRLQLACKRRGISVEKYYEMFAAQEGLCAICRKPETTKQKDTTWRLSIDHDHSFAEGDPRGVRGLLCNRCNVTLGKCRDDYALFVAFADYIHTHRVASANLV